MTNTVFYSWQNDRPHREGRCLIESALERAIGKIGSDTTIEDAIRDDLALDRDTKGVAGQVPIVETIFGKIDAAAVVVPDLTFVGQRADGRPIPNPNVLIEYGWALHSRGHGRIVAVMNTAYGTPSDATLPFDMKHLRHPIQYECPEGADAKTRTAARDALAKDLEHALRLVLASAGKSEPPAGLPLFAPREALDDGPARFRAKGTPIGLAFHPLYQGPGTPITIEPGPAAWLRLMPKYGRSKPCEVDEIDHAMWDQANLGLPLFASATCFDRVRGHDGFGVFAARREKPEIAPSLVYTFTTGEVWAVDTFYLQEYGREPTPAIPPMEPIMCDALARFANLLGRLRFEAPYRWIAGMEGLKGKGIFVPNRPGYLSFQTGPQGQGMNDVVIAEGEFSPPEPPGTALRPLSVALYRNCCIPRPEWLDG